MIDATAGYFCPKHYVKLEKQYILEYILCGSIYMKFKYRPDWSMMIETIVPKEVDWKGAEGKFLGGGGGMNVLHLVWSIYNF